MPHGLYDALGAFVVTCIVIELTPGPNMGYLAVLSASNGRQAGFAATLGIALGLLIVGLLAALGLAAVISSSVVLYEGLRWLGVGYMLWLAWEGWRGAEETSPGDAGDDTKAVSNAIYFQRGLITNLLNPKAAVFYISVLPTFVDASRGVLAQTILLSVVYVAIATTIHVAIVSLAGAARPFLEDPDRSRFVRRILSLALAGIAIWFAFSTARSGAAG
jgi:threonine/homoserine/homoserine lactone efflux protein